MLHSSTSFYPYGYVVKVSGSKTLLFFTLERWRDDNDLRRVALLQLEAVDNLNFARNLKRFLHHAEDVLFRHLVI